MYRYFGLFRYILSIFSIIQLVNSITRPIEAIAPFGMQLMEKLHSFNAYMTPSDST